VLITVTSSGIWPQELQRSRRANCPRVKPNPMGRQAAAFFTEAGLEGLRQLLQDRRAMDPERFAHLRQELGVETRSGSED